MTETVTARTEIPADPETGPETPAEPDPQPTPPVERFDVKTWSLELTPSEATRILEDWFRTHADIPDGIEVRVRLGDRFGSSTQLWAKAENGESATPDSFHSLERRR